MAGEHRPIVNQLSQIEYSFRPERSLSQEVAHSAMATDVVTTLQTTIQELAQAVANMQRAVDELQQEQALQTQAILNTIRGRWDAAQNGAQSAEAILVALSPNLAGKVNALPFVPSR